MSICISCHITYCHYSIFSFQYQRSLSFSDCSLVLGRWAARRRHRPHQLRTRGRRTILAAPSPKSSAPRMRDRTPTPDVGRQGITGGGSSSGGGGGATDGVVRRQGVQGGHAQQPLARLGSFDSPLASPRSDGITPLPLHPLYPRSLSSSSGLAACVAAMLSAI